MSHTYEPGYDLELGKDTDPIEFCLDDDGNLMLCPYCDEPIPVDDDGADTYHHACYIDNWEPGEPDYDAPSMRERMELNYEQKYHGRGL